MKHLLFVWSIVFAVFCGSATGVWAEEQPTYVMRLVVTSELPFRNTPMDPSIDFAGIIKKGGVPGVLNPNSIRVVNAANGETVPCAVTEDFAYGDAGRLEWVIRDPSHKAYKIYFQTCEKRPPLAPAKYTPMIGTGDILRFNAGVPRPIALPYVSGLVDLTGDGQRDLVGTWNYAYRPGWPWDGVICYPRVGKDNQFLYGDLVRVRYVDDPSSTDFKYLSTVYMFAEFADLNGDKLVDMLYTPSTGDRVFIYLNSGNRDAGGMPVFVASGSVPRPTGKWAQGSLRVVDLNKDGVLDLVIGANLLKNTSPKGWPMAIDKDKAVRLDVSGEPCFHDMDGDGLLDAVGLIPGPAGDVHEFAIAWRKNLGGDPPTFGPDQTIPSIDVWRPSYLAAVNDGNHRGLLVQHNVFQEISFYEQVGMEAGKPRLVRFGRAASVSAVMSLSDQAWPFVCDWDGDGDLDLLIGGGYGWPRIVMNIGNNRRPAFTEPQFIESEGKPVRILRDEVLGGKHWHNMGYPYPACVDWDGDGLPDLMLPNETNRIFWYKNLGTRREPKFGPRLQVICDGYPDSPEKRAKSAKLAGDEKVPNNPYPYEEDQPFFWRTGAGFGDMNGDGLMDLITHDCHVRKLTLFTQYRDAEGRLRLKKDRQLKLADGRLIDDSIVDRKAHWTESFKCVDWDGDGLLDVIYSCAGTEDAKGSIYLLRNCGTKTDPVFEKPVTFCCFGKPIKVTAHGPNAYAGDIDGDGKPDLLTCVEWSVYPYYSYAALQMKERPKYTLGSPEERRVGKGGGDAANPL